jgi:hypothetical protein
MPRAGWVREADSDHLVAAECNGTCVPALQVTETIPLQEFDKTGVLIRGNLRQEREKVCRGRVGKVPEESQKGQKVKKRGAGEAHLLTTPILPPPSGPPQTP